MDEQPSGTVILYAYLWAHQYDRGEDAGRKDWPCCVHVIVRKASGTISALFPITTSPAAGRATLAIPDTELRRVGLSAGSHVVVDELNLDDLSESPHIADPHPLGAFSAAFMKRVRDGAAQAIRESRLRQVPRRQ